MRRRSRFGILWRIGACLPFVLCVMVLVVSNVRPQWLSYLSTDRAYAHFFVNGHFIMLRGDYAGWMIERQWREDLTDTLNEALGNQQDTFIYYRHISELQDRVRQSTPPPELTETLAQEATLFFLERAKKTTHWGVLTRAIYWPPRTGTPLKIDALGLRRLVEVSTLPIFAIAVLYCIGVSRQERRQRSKACLSCGYILIGNTSGVCPECGTPALRREPVSELGPGTRDERSVRHRWLGVLVRAMLCVPCASFTAILILGRVAPEAATHLAVDRTYAHFLVGDQFVVLRGPFERWMIEEQWQIDVAQAHRIARENQQDGVARKDLAALRDRVERSVPRPELTGLVARRLSVRILALSHKEEHAGIWTHGAFRPSWVAGPVEADVVALVPLVGWSAIPPVVLGVLGCLRVFLRRCAKRLGGCPSCGHDLADDPHGVCPACGTGAPPVDPAKTGNEP